MSCCSDKPISFHYVTPGMMLGLEYLIYHVKSFGGDSSLWFKTEPNPISLSIESSSEPSSTPQISGRKNLTQISI